MKLLSIIALFTLIGLIQVKADAFCADEQGRTSYTRATICPYNLKEITRNTFCYRVNKSSSEYINHCVGNTKEAKEEVVAGSSDEKVCRSIIDYDGSINHEYEIGINEATKRGLTVEDCKILTNRYTEEEIAYMQEQLALLQKKERIKQFKSDCEEIGFTDGTEAMGNCVLKMMELEGNNTQTIVTTSSGSNTDQELVNIEKEKLKAQREALKIQQDQLRAEQALADQIRRDAIKRQADQSIKQGWCLMNGGGWGCGF
jgi:hypothetical protein